LSELLSYGDYICLHEYFINLTKSSDLKTVLNTPYLGFAETAAIQAQPLIKYYAPDIKQAIVRRDVSEAIEAMCQSYQVAGIPFDYSKLVEIFYRADRELDKLSKSGIFTVAYKDLNTYDGCKSIFEYILDSPFDDDHYNRLKDVNIQMDLAEFVNKYQSDRDRIEQLKKDAKKDLIHLRRQGLI